MGKKLNITEGIFPMPVRMVATYNDDGSAFDPYTHGYYRVSERVGEAFKDSPALK